MAYFAQVDDTGTVLQVISISNDDAPDPAPTNSEPQGQAYIRDVLGLPGTWVQTSFHGNIRRRFCGPGYRYDVTLDVFIEPQPFQSWMLDENGDWQPPSPRPGPEWYWDEETLSWIEVQPLT